ncbi:hypothetical protein P0082_11925 [Candidatus Haliotispira prima]|uniref:IrrE N-terminal-like domain-containing protein n=1 Tax=Candidatus Haliotispira prima TaxID=3034016 RepID=A0ABY8MIZ7_9SPIO|nr:hypothetical protein P0082_11925 [Candidatus Haliotispira prima]
MALIEKNISMENNEDPIEATVLEIVREIKERYKDLHVSYFSNQYYDDDDDMVIKNYEIWYNNIQLAQNNEFIQYILELKKKYLHSPETESICINCNRERIADLDNPYFSSIRARIFKRTELNLNQMISENFKKNICEEVLGIVGSEREHFTSKFAEFKKEYYLNYDSDYMKYMAEVSEKAVEIKSIFPDFIAEIRKFLKDHGIVLLAKESGNTPHEKVDGFAGFVSNSEIPTIVIYYKRGQLRRSFFTIAHEVYHLLYDDNEHLANRFAGLMLVGNYFEDKDVSNPDELLKQGYLELNISMDCIVNSLYDLGKIGKDIRSKLFRRGHLSNLIKETEGFDRDEDENFVRESLGLSDE